MNRIKNCRDGRRRRPVEVEETFAAMASPATKEVQVSISFDHDGALLFKEITAV
jgi:hypothetical protein